MITGPLYDKLKFIAQILLPAVATLYFAIAGIWHLPAAEQVVGTIVAIDTFLGALLGISQAKYKEGVGHGGVMNVKTLATGGKTYTLDLAADPEVLEDLHEVRFSVIHRNDT